MTPPQTMPVPARLSIGRRLGAEPLNVQLSVGTTGEFDLLEILLTIKVEGSTEWTVELSPEAAAYVAGALAQEAGVTFG